LVFNIGDAIADGTDLHGDAVNVAARTQAECPPDGICVTRAVRDHAQDRLGLTFENLGALKLKNIVHPVDAFVVKLDAAAAAQSSHGHLGLRRYCAATCCTGGALISMGDTPCGGLSLCDGRDKHQAHEERHGTIAFPLLLSITF
jgi:hypothetical protein